MVSCTEFLANVLSIIPEVWSSYSERGDRSWSPPAFTQAPGPGGPLSEFPLLDTLRSAHRPQQIGGDYAHVFFFLPFLRPLTDNANGISSTLGSTRAELFDILFAVAPRLEKCLVRCKSSADHGRVEGVTLATPHLTDM